VLIRPKNWDQAKINAEICHTEYEKMVAALFPIRQKDQLLV
jgi:hypothetical protein